MSYHIMDGACGGQKRISMIRYASCWNEIARCFYVVAGGASVINIQSEIATDVHLVKGSEFVHVDG